MTRTTAHDLLAQIDYVMLRDQKEALYRVVGVLDAQPENAEARRAAEDLDGILHLIDWIQMAADTEGLMPPDGWDYPDEEVP